MKIIKNRNREDVELKFDPDKLPNPNLCWTERVQLPNPCYQNFHKKKIIIGESTRENV